ncbi:MAG: beta-N-acetylhexosaminidase [Firmicutes bacterium]|nr:beta-N-acetylhexosaminidase [Bacillota bacterium]
MNRKVFICIILCLVLVGCNNPRDMHLTDSQIKSKNEKLKQILEEFKDKNKALKREKEIKDILDNMTLEEKIGQMLMPRLSKKSDIKEVNEDIKNKIDKYNLGGVILFSHNIVNKNQTIKLVNDLKKAKDIPMFISIDQEGGIVNRIKFGTKFPGNMALGATKSSEYSYKVGKGIGEELNALGINVNFAPVLDVNVNPNNPVIGVRSFGSDPDLVAKLGVAFMKGLQDAKVVATAKHFPGHGDTSVDSHIALPKVGHKQDRLEKIELKPFKEAIDSGIDMIMTSHVVFPYIDDTLVKSKKNNKKVPIPATLSKKVLTGLIREELGFEGVIITDALEMKAISDNFGESEATVKAIKAGADIILIPNNLDVSYNALINAVKKGEIKEKRINESIKRIIDLKITRGIINSKVKDNESFEEIISDNKILESEVAKRAVTLVKNKNNLLPFKLKAGDKILLFAPFDNRLNSMKNSLNKVIKDKDIKDVTIRGFSYLSLNKLNKDLKKEVLEADYIILGSYSKTRSKRLKFILDLVKFANENNKSLVVMALKNPYDIRYIQDIKAYIAIYGDIEPNIFSGMKVIFKADPLGKLPVNIPKRDGKGVLYKKGYGLNY